MVRVTNLEMSPGNTVQSAWRAKYILELHLAACYSRSLASCRFIIYLTLNILQEDTKCLVWYILDLSGLVRYALVWPGLVWSGLVWSGLVLSCLV